MTPNANGDDMAFDFHFDNSYGRLPDRFFTRMAPTPVSAPGLIAVNAPLAEALGLDARALDTPEGAAVFAGNAVPDGADPLAQVYAGHQFGGFSPQLGDGRAILLGEVLGKDGVRRDIQLKGSGRTPYSRGGDGRAWVGPVLREYIVSEFMAAAGVPTTRALAAATTGETILRDGPKPGAVLTRVAQSHIRVGTFQFFAARGDWEGVAELARYAIDRHYPDAQGLEDFLGRVTQAQARLIAHWMSLGFIHGVMNTDNCQIAGETIDYGPCAFLDAYDPAKVFSSIDHGGRYAYGNQPGICLWNLAQLGSALIGAMPDPEASVEGFTAAVNSFAEHYQTAWLDRFGAKIGIAAPTAADRELIEGLLTGMAEGGLDFSNTFRSLDGVLEAGEIPGDIDNRLSGWLEDWRKRLAQEADPRGVMAAANPTIIPRNHRIEAAIVAATDGEFAPFERLFDQVTQPFGAAGPGGPIDPAYLAPPEPAEEVRQTFCGT